MIAPDQLTVLLAEDHEQTRLLLGRILSSAGYFVLLAENGKQAVSLLTCYRVDIAITDLAMPEMDGLELIMFVTREHPTVRIVAFTGSFGEDMLKIAKQLGASATLTKPIQPNTLLSTVEAILGSGPG